MASGKSEKKDRSRAKLKGTVVFPATGTLSLASPSQSRRRPSRITSHVNLRHLSGHVPIILDWGAFGDRAASSTLHTHHTTDQ